MAVDIGLMLEVNGELVSLTPQDVKTTITQAIAKKKLYGKEFALSRPFNVGSAKDLNAFLSKEFGVSLPDKSSFPSPMDKMYDKFTDLELIVESFIVKIPPTHKLKDGTTVETLNTAVDETAVNALLVPLNPAPSTYYKIGLSLQWPPGEPLNLIEGKLAIRGAYLIVESGG